MIDVIHTNHLAKRGSLIMFRAAMTIGAGSTAFDNLRYLVERIPVTVTPAWVKTQSQPVAITDVVSWLVRFLSATGTTVKTLEIGGPDVLPYFRVSSPREEVPL